MPATLKASAYGTADSSNGEAKVVERVKSLTYSASDNRLLLDVEAATTEGSVKTGDVGEVEIVNTGKQPAIAILAYRLWTAEGTMSGNTYHVHHLLKPNQGMIVPDCPAIIVDEDVAQYDGTAVDNAAPSVTGGFAYSDSGILLNDSGVEAADTTITVDDGDLFRVGDLIQLGINDTTATRIEILRVTGISTHVLTVERGLYGTSAADKDAQTDATSGAVDNAKIYFPFFNIYSGEYNRYSVVQTTGSGKFWAKNFFGVGRAGTHLMGITGGWVAIKFYEAGYQNLTNDGNITSSTESGLTAITYYLSIAIDGGTTDKITFTVGSNTNFGGNDGVIQRLQDAIDALYYNPAKNGYEKGATVEIIDGDVRITSNQRLSTSAISVTTNTDGTAGTDELFDGTNKFGRLPAIIPTAVAAKLPDDVTYDRVTYDSIPNESAFIYDDGYGNLYGNENETGTINYETGEIKFTGAPANAEFVYSCLHTSPFSGRANATNSAKMNKLKAIYWNLTNQKGYGELTITRR